MERTLRRPVVRTNHSMDFFGNPMTKAYFDSITEELIKEMIPSMKEEAEERGWSQEILSRQYCWKTLVQGVDVYFDEITVEDKNITWEYRVFVNENQIDF